MATQGKLTNEPQHANCLACSGPWPSSSHFFDSLGLYIQSQEQALL